MKCSVCGCELPEGAAFCGNCGAAAAARFCGDCGREIPTGAEECPYCTAEKEASAGYTGGSHCPQCGAAISGDELFCGSCGYSIQRKSRLPVVAAVMAGLAVLAVAAVIAVLVIKSNSEDSTEIYASPFPTVSAQPTETPAIETIAPQTEAPLMTNIPQQSQYLFNSDREYITAEYLNTKTRQEIRLILNEMYARHGYIFNNESYQQYFSAQSWYVPRYTSDAEAEAQFNSVEIANKNTIINYEISRGWR